MQRNAALKPVRRADDLVPFSGACQDCLYRLGIVAEGWRCGAHGGRHTSIVRNPEDPCRLWQPRPRYASLRSSAGAIVAVASIIIIFACTVALIVAATQSETVDERRRHRHYRECLDQGHPAPACAPLLEGSSP